MFQINKKNSIFTLLDTVFDPLNIKQSLLNKKMSNMKYINNEFKQIIFVDTELLDIILLSHFC